MKKIILASLLLIYCPFNGVSADQVSCERIETRNWGWGVWKTCYMDQTTEINSADTTIATRDESVQAIWFHDNRKIKFLPINISEKFPNLEGLGAAVCSLTTISKANFKGLSKLSHLHLGDNQIEKIPSDAFNDLVALEKLLLYNIKLKFINGRAFARLIKLTDVMLSYNQCINEDFEGPPRIAVLQETVDEKCSYDEELDEYVKKTFSIVSSLADKKCEKSQDFSTVTTTIQGMKAETSEINNKLKELKTQQREECGSIAKALEAQTKTCKDQQTYFNEALANKTAEIIDVKVKSEVQTMLKMTEIQRLEEELQRKNAEIIEKNKKIKDLEQKNSVLLGSAGNCP